nr:RNA-directed DNA polymerase, eukaryota, nucleotide-binding alpha-beta plait domain protein [Tanacetum cinerariifolium]
MASPSASNTHGVSTSSAPTVVQILPNNRNPLIWKDFNLCLMSDNTKKAQCIHCFHFFLKDSNWMLKNHISHLHCEALKRILKSRQSSMSRDGSIFEYNPDVLREQFAGLVIQRGLPFNHFDDEQTTKVFQKHLQPKYNHVVCYVWLFYSIHEKKDDNKSKEDEVHKISTSVFVTNFPDQSNAKDLWNACAQYGYVVDAFIPNRRSKAGKRFGFVRFIKVFDVERLVNNLCGSLVNEEVDNNSALVLDESCLNLQDYSRCLMGKVKDFGSLSNLKVVLGSEGFDNIDIRYLGGFWVMIKFLSEEVKKKFQSNVGTGTWFSQFQQASTDFITYRRVTWVELEGSFKIIYQGKAYWVRAKEVPGWVPDFVEQDDEESDSDEEHSEGELNGDIVRSNEDLKGDNEKDVIPDTVFEDNLPKSHDGEASVGQNKVQSEDPFNIYILLNKKKENDEKISVTHDSLKYPPGFTPKEDVETNVEQSKKRNGSVREVGEEANRSDDMKSALERIISKEEGTESVCSGHFKKSETPRSCGSILSLMDELVKVGQTIRYNMDGCVKNIEEII